MIQNVFTLLFSWKSPQSNLKINKITHYLPLCLQRHGMKAKKGFGREEPNKRHQILDVRFLICPRPCLLWQCDSCWEPDLFGHCMVSHLCECAHLVWTSFTHSRGTLPQSTDVKIKVVLKGGCSCSVILSVLAPEHLPLSSARFIL